MTTPQCELCSSDSNVSTYQVPGAPSTAIQSSLMICETCQSQIEQPEKRDTHHFRCLGESIWSENPAVKVLAWRILNSLSSEGWAQDLLEQLYLEDELLEWAKAGVSTEAESGDSELPRDSNGTALNEGDSVTLIKDLDVKGAGFTAKRGTLVKKISLTGDPGLVEGRVNGTQIVLKTCFLKKSN